MVMISSFISASEQIISAILGSIGLPNISGGSEGIEVRVN